MTTQTRVSAKGQVVLPKEVRDRLHWQVGTRLEVIERPGAVTLRAIERRNPFPRTTIEDLRRWPAYRGEPKSVEEISSLNDDALREMFKQQERDASA